MGNEATSLFERLNAPFLYSDYQYDSFGDRCYISGQCVTERLNEVLGVGYWKYEGLYETEKIIQEPNAKNPRVKMYVRFSLYNNELKDWITFVDVGSEQVKPGMNEGDATKSAITDGMKKCASRIGVGSDLYKGMITWDKQKQMIVVPASYSTYYQQMGWPNAQSAVPDVSTSTPPSTSKAIKASLTNKLKQKNTTAQSALKQLWQELATNLDGFDEWVQKKQAEKMSDQQCCKSCRNDYREKAEMQAHKKSKLPHLSVMVGGVSLRINISL
ncbi:Rad52/Rad22 family DNA repair protein [Paenibacillus glycanilyticus]|uniref:Rad52/Rad22 family DNA repair protein n=1 Tax=Paenibacillus glycanilyticus TaxID=126569 RepID=UPI00203B64FD|nr:Rad52/Rad22 family DNA repair protein [Paenibacillus glycanilyticus]MCM3631497.1 Rad52/Rad22 family DNA repair protein [Paenibacillus glycanilyticus]